MPVGGPGSTTRPSGAQTLHSLVHTRLDERVSDDSEMVEEVRSTIHGTYPSHSYCSHIYVDLARLERRFAEANRRLCHAQSHVWIRHAPGAHMHLLILPSHLLPWYLSFITVHF